MGKYLGHHEISTIGDTGTLSVGAATDRADLTTVAESGSFPFTVVIRSNIDVYVRQGGSAITADSTDFVLKANVYMRITVLDDASRYLAALRVGSTSGELRYTRNNSLTPGTTA